MSNVPKLRFKEFSGEWEENKFEKFCNKIASGKSKQSDNGLYNLYGSTGIIGFTNEYSNDGKYILIARVGANAGLTNVVEGKFGVTDNTLVVDLKNIVDINFILSSLQKYDLNRLIFGSGQPLITGGQLKSLKLNVPQKKEQEKIALFLTSVDYKIEQLIKKEALLQQYKKGVMQKIFNQEIRFKADDGSEFCDWEEKKLSQIFSIIAGQSKSKYLDENGNKIIVDMGGISSEPKLVAKKYTFLDDDYLTTNDLVMPKDDIGGGFIIGKVIAIPENNKYICGDHIYKLTIKEGHIIFLQYVINSYKVNKSFRQKANGTAQIGLNKKEVDNQAIPFPCIEEQAKIADFLSSIDSKIEQVQKQLNSTKEFKKALLQQMFV